MTTSRTALTLLAALLPALAWTENAPADKPADKPADAPAAAPPKPAVTIAWADATGDLAGSTWGPGGVRFVAVVPGSGTVIAGVSEKWLWSSADGGQTWTALGATTNAKNRPSDILFDPKNPQAFWVASDVGSPGLVATVDGGATFKPLAGLDGVASFDVDLKDEKRKTIVVGPREKDREVPFSVNGGGFFSKASKFPKEAGWTQQVLVLDEKTWLVAANGFDKKSKKEKEVGIWRTEDAGKTWAKVHTSGPTGHAVVASSGAILWPFGDKEGILRSNTKGKTWAALGEACKLAPMELPKKWLAAVGDQQLVVSTDGGESWDPVGQKLPYQPDGAVWCEQRSCFFAWRASEQQEREAVLRLDVPADLQELVSPTLVRDLVLWDGDDKAPGGGWANEALATLAKQDAVARQGRGAMQWKVAGEAFFTNCGWFLGVYPASDAACTDVSGYGSLVLALKCDGAAKPTKLFLTLTSFNGKEQISSKTVDLLDATTKKDKILDGQWHEIAIPLAQFKDVDLKKVCGIGLTANNGKNKFDYQLILDNIGVAK